jgi:acyl-[acyl-carrier-protein]-phospholipid O-acyltransferase / long-chain-fatty-acid--[acyl-carrier-protein] ligase
VTTLLRVVLHFLTHRIYEIRLIGGENIPAQGPALLIANHLSLVDGFLVGAVVKRPVRFLVWRPYYEDKRFHWLMKRMNAIPVSETDASRGIMRSLLVARQALEQGDLVCLFAEGQISRTGNLLAFKRGFEVMIKGTDVPVVPVNLDRVWGSIFSFEHGKALFKWPRRIPYPVTLTFGRPLKPPVAPAVVRQAVLDLGVDAFKIRLESMQPLPVEFLKRVKKQPRVLAVADSSGLEMSYGKLAAVSRVFSGQLAPHLSDKKHVGVLLPSSVGGVLANIAILFLGRTPVNLNYTTGASTLALCVKKAGIDRILTSRKVLEKTNLPEMPGMFFIEDLVKKLPKMQVVRERLLLSLLPTNTLVRRWTRAVKSSLSDEATILFSSGSTGIPKGVILTHANILSNILGLSQVFDVGPKDRMIGVLPFFHSFGFTATFWFPLIAGFSGVYHNNPLDAKIVGELSAKYEATLLLATPTFLSAYTRKCTPEQFRHMRYIITGAERLRESVRQAFEEKFGKKPLEGYGCTELSPVATVNVNDISMGDIHQIGNKAGTIGRPIPGVSVRIVDPDTHAPLPQGEKGMILVRGLNVMKGYLDDEAKTREVIIDGWYVTGDMGLIDEDGFVKIVDRLSRFSKIGGEMVPHMLIEEKLQQLSGLAEPAFAVSGVSDEKRGEALVVLYAETAGVDVEALYARLKESGLPNLWMPAREHFYAVPALPYLGTGKLDLAGIKAIAREKTGRS